MFAKIKAIAQIIDNDNGNNKDANGIKKTKKSDLTKNALPIQYNPRKNHPKENDNET